MYIFTKTRVYIVFSKKSKISIKITRLELTILTFFRKNFLCDLQNSYFCNNDLCDNYFRNLQNTQFFLRWHTTCTSSAKCVSTTRETGGRRAIEASQGSQDPKIVDFCRFSGKMGVKNTRLHDFRRKYDPFYHPEIPQIHARHRHFPEILIPGNFRKNFFRQFSKKM